jgi:hypothetical protein
LVEEFEEATARGEGGFGSTDSKKVESNLEVPFTDENGYIIPPSHITISSVRPFETIYFNSHDNEVKSVNNHARKLPNWWLK